MRFSALVLLSAVGLVLAAPAVEVEQDGLETRQSGLGCVYGNNQCPAKCRARYGRACTLSYVRPSPH